MTLLATVVSIFRLQQQILFIGHYDAEVLHINEHLSNNFHSSESTPECAQCGLITARELPLCQLENTPVEEGRSL